jgi:Protein of unknwon function (DUF2893).
MTNTDFEYTLKFFSTTVFKKPRMTTLKKEGDEILASIPEQAFLECLLLAPSLYAYMDLFYIMEQLTTIRPDVVQELLENTDNLKIKRLFLYMAQKAKHEWYNRIDRSKIEGGIYISEYRITIPKELHEYE